MALGSQDDSTLSLSKAIQIALIQNHQIEGENHTVAGAAANLSGAKQPLNPTATVLGYTHSNPAFDPLDPANFGVQFTVETSGRQAIRTRQAKFELAGAKADSLTTKLTVVSAVRSAYLGIELAQANLDIEKQSYDDAKKLADLTSQQFKVGATSQSNSIRAQIALAQESQNLTQAQTQIPLAKANLNLLLGRDAEAPFEISETLSYKQEPRDLSSLQELALRQRSELRSAEFSQKALQAAVDLQRSQYRPDLIVGVNPTGVQSGQVEFGVSFPLFDFGSIRENVRQAKEAVYAQDSQIRQIKQQILLDVRTAYLNLTQAKLIVETLGNGVLPQAQSLVEKTREGFRLGGNTILDVLDAESTYRTTQSSYASAVSNYALALAQLDRATGSLNFLDGARS
jgi:cobalt-zinc-cadmium efflux system outer membrane protein